MMGEPAAAEASGAAERVTGRQLLHDMEQGLWAENPPLRMLIGMCPVLAITTAAINGLIMGAAVTFVLLVTGAIVSAMRRVIPDNVRIPVFVVIIATAVTITDMTLAGLVPAVHQALGIFVPLIVVNCIILARAEAFASKHPVPRALADGLGMGLGVTWGLVAIALIRELLANGTVFGHTVVHAWWTSIGIFSLPPGAFLTLGLTVALLNWAVRLAGERRAARSSAVGATTAAAATPAGGR